MEDGCWITDGGRRSYDDMRLISRTHRTILDAITCLRSPVLLELNC